MFESKYSRLLTGLLIAGIVLIIGTLTAVGIIIDRNSKQKKEAEDNVSRYQEEVEKNRKANEENEKDKNTNAVTPIIGMENLLVTDSSTDSSKVVKTYKGFVMPGTIEIPAINLSYPILKGGAKAMNEGIILYEDHQELNTIGNVTLAGHNYRDGRFFSNNKKLVEGDKVYITDNTGMKVEYVIYKIFTTTPEDSTYMERDTAGKREISLTTCTDDTQSRLIVLAKEQ